MTPDLFYKRKERGIWQRPKEKGHGKTEAETGVTQPQAKGHQEPLIAARANSKTRRGNVSEQVCSESGPDDPMIEKLDTPSTVVGFTNSHTWLKWACFHSMVVSETIISALAYWTLKRPCTSVTTLNPLRHVLLLSPSYRVPQRAISWLMDGTGDSAWLRNLWSYKITSAWITYS